MRGAPQATASANDTMTSNNDRAVSGTGGDQRDWSRHTLKDEEELEERDRREGHDYIPMDLYIDRAERHAHFSASVVLARLRRTGRSSPLHRR